MKVFDLACEAGHLFEGWFGSSDDWTSQQARGLVSCPMCGSARVERRPSAARLNLATGVSGVGGPVRAAQSGTAPAAGSGPVPRPDGPAMGAPPLPAGLPPEAEQAVRALQGAWLKMAEAVRRNTEDVGERFAEEARRIHYDEAPARGIRGKATPEQAAELAEEGIEVFSMPMPEAPEGPLQ